MDAEIVVNFNQFFHPVFLQHYEPFQPVRRFAGTVLTVHHVLFVLFLYEQDVEHLNLAVDAVVRRLVLPAAVELDFQTQALQIFHDHLALLQCS